MTRALSLDSARRNRLIVERYAAGVTHAKIAEELGIARAAVSKRLRKLGVEPNRKSRYCSFPILDVMRRLLDGEPGSSIARSMGIGTAAIWMRLTRRGLRSGDLRRYRAFLRLDADGLKAFEEAWSDGLSIPDAMEIAVEYLPARQRRAA